MLDVQAIRKDFPILDHKIYDKPLIYFDNGATTQKPRQVVEKIENAETALDKMKLNHQITPLENPSEIKAARRDIARMKTELRMRELNK